MGVAVTGLYINCIGTYKQFTTVGTVGTNIVGRYLRYLGTESVLGSPYRTA
jgi:hypothetical protein